jgi:hypothetical protein
MYFLAQHAPHTVPHAYPHAAPYAAPSVSTGGMIASMLGSCVFSLIVLAITVVALVGLWKVFVKAGQPGWAAIIPIYNIVILLQIIGRPIWWLIPFFLPIITSILAVIGLPPSVLLPINVLLCVPSFVFWIMVCLRLARVFDQSSGFGIGLLFLPFIFLPLLGFGDAEYLGADVA